MNLINVNTFAVPSTNTSNPQAPYQHVATRHKTLRADLLHYPAVHNYTSSTANLDTFTITKNTRQRERQHTRKHEIFIHHILHTYAVTQVKRQILLKIT